MHQNERCAAKPHGSPQTPAPAFFPPAAPAPPANRCFARRPHNCPASSNSRGREVSRSATASVASAPLFAMKRDHAPQIDSADHIDVVHEERLDRILREKTTRPSSIRRRCRAASSSREISIRIPKLPCACQIRHNHVRVVMRVDDHLAHAEAAQAAPAQSPAACARQPSTSALGRSSVSGRRRVPSPAARTIAFITRLTGESSPVAHLLQFDVPHHDFHAAASPRRCFASCSAR